MKLNIAERLALLNVLPMQGDIVVLRLVQDLRMALSFSEKEMEDWKINNRKVEGGAVITWDEDFTHKTKDFTIGEALGGIIRQRLSELNSQKQLSMDMIPLYEKFVEGAGKEKVKA